MNTQQIRKQVLVMQGQHQTAGQAPSQTPRQAHGQTGHSESGQQR